MSSDYYFVGINRAGATATSTNAADRNSKTPLTGTTTCAGVKQSRPPRHVVAALYRKRARLWARHGQRFCARSASLTEELHFAERIYRVVVVVSIVPIEMRLLGIIIWLFDNI